MANDKIVICQECGMPCGVTEFHPMAACLMFKGCHDSDKVRANLAALASHTGEADPEGTCQEDDGCPTEKAVLQRFWRANQATPPAATPAAPGEVTDTLADLRAAVAFLDQVRAAHDNGDDVNGTGAAKDARQWLEKAARAALSNPAPVASQDTQPVPLEWADARPVAAPAPASEAVALTQDDRNAIDRGIEAIEHMHRAGDWGDCCPEYIASLRKIADVLAAPTTGDSADAPVQQAGEVTEAQILQAMPPHHRRRTSLENVADVRAALAALKGEQPVEPSGTERGNAA